MAFEGLYQNIDFQAGNKAAALKQQQFQQMLGMALENYQAGKDRQLKQKQLEAEAIEKSYDIGKQSEIGFMKLQKGVPFEQLNANEQAAVKHSVATDVGSVRFNPETQQMEPVPPKLGAYRNMIGGMPSPVSTPPSYSTPFVPPSTGGGYRPDLPIEERQVLAAMENAARMNGGAIDGREVVPMDEGDIEAALGGGKPIDSVVDKVISGKPAKNEFLEKALTPLPYQIQNTTRGAIAEYEENKQISREQREFETAKRLKNIDAQIAASKEALKTKEGKQKIADIIERMDFLNTKLLENNAIMSEQTGLGDRAITYLASSKLGQEGRQVTNPQAQKYAQEYEALRNTLLPFYASAADLGAKSLDSDAERQGVMSSFGDTGGLYETNKSQLDNLRTLFDVGGAQKTDNSAGYTPEQAMEELRRRGKL